MARKPATLLYGLDDRPSPGVLFMLALQHNFLMASTLLLPVVLISEIGGPPAEVQSVVGLTMIAAGIGTILQTSGRLGSGYLCPNLCGPNFFAASAEAAWLGGLPLMRGMTMVAGLVEALLAPLLRHLKFLFPTEVTGLVVFMVGVSLVPVGASKFLGIDYTGDPIRPVVLLVATVTFLLMAVINVRGGPRLKLYSVLIGLVVGYALSAATGLVPAEHWSALKDAPLFALPFHSKMLDVRFEWSLVPPFAIVSICGALKSMGNLITCQKANDDDWQQPDMKRVSKGIFADSLSVMLAGALGGMATDTSSSNVGLSQASGATSRVIGVVAGVMFVLYGFSPKVTMLLSMMPQPVMGAIVVFVTCFMMLSGLQILLTTKPRPREIFVVGVAMFFGLSLDIMPQLYVSVPSWLRPMFQSSLTLSAILAVILNQVLRQPKPVAR
ncbi:MAG: Xanthine/uracil permease [Rariglobus sp.]|jgi:NCS2 family nucleobase:cation symporter-2|nr:Xanthine/uracil permease [Rariglobus sp.]